ncbi:MAG: hypothetical protein DI598_18350 [Pseudopedobacter saltans]|uniref:Activator of Hsp90 ATPase homologue 1/2-like C-terminal domain-containing protein n=1 Tax=Pseudopedobacter saltans TaxID=151895 RepID=A0A2W5EGV5_9SPHI|nr:MAG: hypothetical protein DI598_18350 [Pseudopedobacter saltans]
MIKVQVTVNAPIQQVWESYNNPSEIQKWNFASEDWYCPHAESDFVVGGRFSSTMSAKDNSFSFDFSGHFTEIIPDEKLAYHIEDGRNVVVLFSTIGKETHIDCSFEPEHENPEALQQEGWQAILNNFKSYVENKS